MPLNRSPIFACALFSLMALGGCASTPPAGRNDSSVEALLRDEKFASLGGPETSTFADVRSLFTAEELRFLHEHIRDVERYANATLQGGSVSSAWIAGYFRIESSLPLLRQLLLTDRYFYGWEGPDPEQESSYLLDEQYTHHRAYIAAIEAITGKSLRESIELTPAEIDNLKSEASIDFAKRGSEPEKVQRGLCARWLLSKLMPPASGGG